MILELYTKNGTFLSLVIEKQSELVLKADKENIVVFYKGFETQIKFNEKFDVLINLVGSIREEANDAMREKQDYCHINLDSLIHDIKLDLE
ncbi:hypothetical protein L8V83_00985 [Campylobacter lari]|uniref:Uncharacterized protein n=1 Tax=Campylobacter lari TaxID=201 RepID=A0A698FVK1_CAMLA|nr:hypothetical protein [Campylobacter sp. IFREMER_LSEM_CL2101]EAK9998184.1 hypothetical protein [Campylobacter lari]ECW8954952.1 hypothetical protein [Campylobacter lari]MCV3392151.1 hypothetical protein [Campylobacter sp. IFREMER_LSEM_CL2101]MCV3397850.1 hypothetical protein [Campylobacter lari]